MLFSEQMEGITIRNNKHSTLIIHINSLDFIFLRFDHGVQRQFADAVCHGAVPFPTANSRKRPEWFWKRARPPLFQALCICRKAYDYDKNTIMLSK